MTIPTNPFPWQAATRITAGGINVYIWNPLVRRWQFHLFFAADSKADAETYVARHNEAQRIENEEFGCNGEQGPVSGWKE